MLGRASERERLLAEAEARLGRSLYPSERHVDVAALDLALAEGKNRLEAVIRDEVGRVLDERRRGVSAVMQVTPAVLDELERLRAVGRAQAEAELASMGFPAPRRLFATGHDDLPARLRALVAVIRAALNLISVRVAREEAHLEAESTPMTDEFLAKLEQAIPGARDVASRVVSGAVYSGLGEVYSERRDLFPCWIYTAMMDSATCPPCAALDGTEYDTWEEIMLVLPDGGPNPECLGDGRCRCRVVPCLPE